LSGGTFTISNMGMMDVESFGPIINPGEKRHPRRWPALGRSRFVRDGKIVVRQMMKVHALVRPSHRGRRAWRKIHQRHSNKT